MNSKDFPSLYVASDISAANSQAFYLRLLRLQYIFLIVAAAVVYFYPKEKWLGGVYLALIFASVIFALLLIWRKPEKDWYRYRALAESIKTRTWLYIMRAPPFADFDDEREVATEFRKDIQNIWEANKSIRARKLHLPSNDRATPAKLFEVRLMTMDQRKDLYTKERISEQLGWYRKKASWNDARSKVWAGIVLVMYALAIGIVIESLISARPSGFIFSPAVFLVAASSALGWIQIKKFNELAAAYSLTAHEITMAHEEVIEASDEVQFGQAVENVELVFSREHTQWVARQQA